jgi:hypothetical protein
VWNPTAASRWNHLRTLLSRYAEDLGGRLEFFRVVEVQDGKRCDEADCGRGGLHLHVLVRFGVMPDPLEVQRLAIQAGFGCSVSLDRLPAARAARYVAKYAAKGYTHRSKVPWKAWHSVVVDEGWVDYRTGEVHPEQTEQRFGDCVATYRTVSQSKNWGLTHREVLEARKAAARAAAERQRQKLADALVAEDCPPVRWVAPGDPADPP